MAYPYCVPLTDDHKDGRQEKGTTCQSDADGIRGSVSFLQLDRTSFVAHHNGLV